MLYFNILSSIVLVHWVEPIAWFVHGVFTQEKRPQINFSHQNFRVEHSIFPVFCPGIAVERKCVPNIQMLDKELYADGCFGDADKAMTSCYCSTDYCNSSNSIGILNIAFFGSLALFYLMN